MRHGETLWSVSGQHTGRADIPLTEHGEDEARALGDRIRSITFDHVLTSPLKRAQKTCELAGLSKSAVLDDDLMEWDNGSDEGRTPADILAERPGWNLFRDGSPDGESPDQISARVDRLTERLKRLDGNVALFSHSHLGRVLAARWIGLPARAGENFILNTASHSELSLVEKDGEVPTIVLWNS